MASPQAISAGRALCLGGVSAEGSGGLPEYSGFQSIYTGMLMSAMTQDLMALQYSITSAIMWPVYSIGTALALGMTSLINTYLSSVFLAPLAIPLMPVQMAGAAMATSALAQIMAAQLTWQISLLLMVTMMFATVSAGQMTGIEEVRSKQRQYDDAQASLNYFTKVGSVEALKDRAQAWGAQHNDEDAGETGNVLFELTDEDLKYLIENGNMTGLTAEEQTEALDLTAQKDTTKFYDSYGRRYDPNTITTGYPGPIVDGKYGGTHTRITRQLPNGTTEPVYALIIPDANPANEVYSMDSIFDAAVSHGMQLRNLRRDRYESAGANAAAVTQDGTFVLSERDATYDYLYNEATRAGVGGREFAGYTMAYEDYERNVRNVFEGELQQREAVQRKEWEYRAAELQSRYEAWERRMATVLERGAKAWQRSEDRYLQAQRNWERDEDRKAAESQKKWDEAIQAHYTKREQWETEVRNAAASGTISNNLTQAVSGINDQIAQFEAATGLSMPQVDRQAFVNQAIAELQLKQPSLTERFQNVNQSISSFNTTMSLSQMAGTDLTGLSALGAEFRAQVREHQRDMRVYTNTKMFEQYQKLEDNFIEQIKRQDKAIEQETRMAALGAGLVEQGDMFVKLSASTGFGIGGFVNAYKNFDVEGEVARLKAEQGQSGQSMLEGEALVSFLQGANDVEVEAYFSVAKLQMESIFYKIVGRGNSEERLRSKELADIGTFGVWAGRKPGSEELSGLSQAAAHYGPEQFAHLSRNGGELDFLNYANGFGELGALGPRPGGAPMGFYAQLDLLGRLNSQWDSKAIADAGYVNPVASVLNAINPMMMVANSVKNVEVGERVYGRDRGKLIEAQGLVATKTALQAVAGAVAFVPVIGQIIGAILGTIAGSIEVDPLTGERMFRVSDRSLHAGVAGAIPGGVLLTMGAQYCTGEKLIYAARSSLSAYR